MKTVREMAEEAGFALWSANSIDDDEIVADTGVVITDQLERFYALARAQALEEAANACERMLMPSSHMTDHYDDEYNNTAIECARAIRALVKEK